MKRRVREPESVKMLKEAFKVFDTSGDGRVSRSFMLTELMKTGQIDLEEVEEMLSTLDVNDDGFVQIEDFLKLLVDEKPMLKQNKTSSFSCCFL